MNKVNLLCLLMLLISFTTRADEGMWTFNHFPTKTVQTKYGFQTTKNWLDEVRLSSARLAGGCSASFVSKSGLVMTNHHCAHSCIHQLSTAKKDFVAAGFYAKDMKDEVKCPEIEVNRLVDIQDVTKDIRQATKGLKDKAFNDALKATTAKIEKDCSQGSEDVRCDVVTLYHGGEYNLYKYQRYQDVRLVFAPEMAIAFFGGDPDNFMFPRYNLDLTFLRVYDKGEPLKNEHFFKWSKVDAKENDLAFVVGHPGSTSRLLTIAQLEDVRDRELPYYMSYLSELRGGLTEYGKRGAEQRRVSEARLFGIENSLKAMTGKQKALVDKEFFAKKVAAEKQLRQKVNANPKLKKEFGDAWDQMAKAVRENEKIDVRRTWIEQATFGSKLFGAAKTLRRAALELPKKNEERFEEFTDSKLPQMKQRLFSSAPIDDDFEIWGIEFGLTKLREYLRADDPFVKKAFGDRSPAEIAKAIVKGTKLKDVKARQALFDGGQKAIDESKDPMIEFARLFEEEGRKIRKTYEDEIETVLKQSGEKVAQAQFAAYGSKVYPDATFTLRVSYGQVKGYEENGKMVNPITLMGGTFDRHTGREPFALPKSWLEAKTKLNLATPMNMATTNDIIGGNSGSPVVNKNREIIGLIFDGNIQSLGGDYGFDETVNRAISVHSAAMTESLEKVYRADRIVKELRGE